MSRRSDIFESMRTQQLRYQNPDNTYPSLGAVLAMSDRRGTVTPTLTPIVNRLDLRGPDGSTGEITYDGDTLLLNGTSVSGVKVSANVNQFLYYDGTQIVGSIGLSNSNQSVQLRTDLIPDVSGEHDVGSMAIPIRDLYASNSLNIGRLKLSASGDYVHVRGPTREYIIDPDTPGVEGPAGQDAFGVWDYSSTSGLSNGKWINNGQSQIIMSLSGVSKGTISWAESLYALMSPGNVQCTLTVVQTSLLFRTITVTDVNLTSQECIVTFVTEMDDPDWIEGGATVFHYSSFGQLPNGTGGTNIVSYDSVRRTLFVSSSQNFISLTPVNNNVVPVGSIFIDSANNDNVLSYKTLDNDVKQFSFV
jgi:hypothetical protein